jgi:hypothetical protein
MGYVRILEVAELQYGFVAGWNLRWLRRLKDVAVAAESEVLLALPGW